MKITINNATPDVSEVGFIKTQDIYGSVILMRGWK